MSGWSRLGWVLSLIYWAFALFMVWAVYAVGGGDAESHQAAGVLFFLALAAYGAATALCWAISGFARR